LCQGGNGINDLNHTYSVSAIGMNKAAEVAYRTLTVYLTPSAQYSESRFFSIQAARDLYGDCSPEAASVANAWYAVGIGLPYAGDAISDFKIGPSNVYCSTDDTVRFSNLSSNATSYTWDFGDGNISTDPSPYHVYNSYGAFDIKLIAASSCGLSDTLRLDSAIQIKSDYTCEEMPYSGRKIFTECRGILTDNGGFAYNYEDFSDGAVTIAPIGSDSIILHFTSFDLEYSSFYDGDSNLVEYADYLTVYDGLNTNARKIGSYTGHGLPNGGVIKSSGGAITLKMESDYYGNLSGFVLDWQCSGEVGNVNSGGVLNIFPNPGNGDLFIYLESPKILNKFIEVSAYDCLGQKIYYKKEFSFGAEFISELDLRKFSNGIYFIKVEAGSLSLKNKVLIEE
jgi:PKD repeat protein